MSAALRVERSASKNQELKELCDNAKCIAARHQSSVCIVNIYPPSRYLGGTRHLITDETDSGPGAGVSLLDGC
jgi:hypothetical protein